MKPNLRLATLLLAIACLFIAGLATAGETATHFTSVVIDDALSVTGATTLTGNLAITSADVGGGYGATGCTLTSAGALSCDGNLTSPAQIRIGTSPPTITGTGAAVDGKLTLTDLVDARGGLYDSGGSLVLGDATQITGTLDVLGAVSDSGGDLVLNDAVGITLATTIGGGYGSTGCTISEAGVLQCNGALTGDSSLTIDNVGVGGGYGAAGCTITTAGVLSCNGAATIDGALNVSGAVNDPGGTLTLNDAVQITGTLDILGPISDSGGPLMLDDDVVLINDSIYDSGANLVLDDAVDVSGNLVVTGTLRAYVPVTAITTDTLATTAQRGSWFTDAITNTTLTLPAAASGLSYCLYNYAGDNLYLDVQTGDQIHVLTNATGNKVSNSTAGDSICLLAVDTTYWIATSRTGTWTDAD
jgi:hypothetical protein